MSRNKYPEQTVEKILDAAACLFAQKGYAHTTLQDVIDETGLSKGAVYHHFKSKEEIAAKVGDRMGAEFTATLAHIRDDDAMTGLQKLQAVFAASLLPQRQQALDLLEKTIPIYITPMIQQGTTDGSIHTADAAALGEALFLLADLWLHPLTRPTTPDQQRARCAVFRQVTQGIGLDLLTEEQSAQMVKMCKE